MRYSLNCEVNSNRLVKIFHNRLLACGLSIFITICNLLVYIFFVASIDFA
jgi:hypothetical protein